MKQNKEKVAAVILAAGMSTRMGAENKLLKLWQSKPLVSHVFDAAMESVCDTVIVVTGFQSERVQETLEAGNSHFIHNSEFASGMASSIVVGVKYAILENHTNLIILLGDMPQITSAMIDKLIAGSLEHPGKIISASCNGKRGNPVLWPSVYFEELLGLEGGAGAKDLLANADDELITIEFGIAARFDLDTRDAFDNES